MSMHTLMTTAAENSEDTNFALQDIYDQVLQNLQLSNVSMQRQYNKDIRLNNYHAGGKVWLKVAGLARIENYLLVETDPGS